MRTVAFAFGLGLLLEGVLAHSHGAHHGKQHRERHHGAVKLVEERGEQAKVPDSKVIFDKRDGDGPAGEGVRTNHLQKRYSGTGTFYNAETGQQGACGGFITNNDWSVAIDEDMYGDLGAISYWCGKTIAISANGKTTYGVVIRDACPGCPSSASLDLTPGLFSYFADQSVGVLSITWWVDDGGAPSSSSSSKPPPSSTKKPAPSSSSWTPVSVSLWTPSSSSSQWTPSSSSSKWTPPPSPSSTWKAPSSSSSWKPSSSSSWTSNNPTATANVNSTSLTNYTTAASTNVTHSALNGTSGANDTNTPSTGSITSAMGGSTGGTLYNAAQIVIDLGLLVVEASKSIAGGN